MTKVKIIKVFTDHLKLEETINEWVKDHDPEIFDIKYAQSTNLEGLPQYSAMIIYKGEENE